MRGSIFEFNIFRPGRVNGLFVWLALFVFIQPGGLYLNSVPISEVWVAFKVDQSDVLPATIILFSSISIFILVLGRLSKLKIHVQTKRTENNFSKKLLWWSVSLLLSFLLIANYLGYTHAFLSALSGENLSNARSVIRSGPFLLQMLVHLSIVYPYFVSILAKKYIRIFSVRFLFYLMLLILVTYQGSKAPLFTLLIIIIANEIYINNMVVFRYIMFGLIIFLLSLFMLQKVVVLQYETMTENSIFLDYLVQRVFVGGIIGYYEQYSINIRDFDYIFNTIPFYSSLFDVSNYSKDLMLLSETRVGSNTIGIKNTFFIAEASAIFGWLAIPVVVVLYIINYLLGMHVVRSAIRLSSRIEIDISELVLPYTAWIKVSGGLSDVLFLKNALMTSFLLFMVFFLSRLRLCKTSSSPAAPDLSVHT